MFIQSRFMRIMFKRSVIAALSLFAASAAAAQSLPEMRMTPAEIRGSTLDNNQIGSAGVPGVHTKVIDGDPAKAGSYSILLFVPAHTTIQAHSHRDDRMATVVSGEWHFGYGNQFDAKSLKTLPPGSVYSEPGGDNHFAQTDTDPVVVVVSGYGPTDTHYFDPMNDPKAREKK
jgi:quercetin dioxygenase-like cupin family protein